MCNSNTTYPINWQTPASAPSIHEEVTWNQSGSSVEIKWNGVEFHGTPAFYNVTCADSNKTYYSSLNFSQTNVTTFKELRRDTQWNCTVTAHNAEGFSASDSVLFTLTHDPSTNVVAGANLSFVVNNSAVLLLQFPWNQSFQFNDTNGNPLAYAAFLFQEDNCVKRAMFAASGDKPFNETLLQDLTQFNADIEMICPGQSADTVEQRTTNIISHYFKSLQPATTYRAVLYVVNKAGFNRNISTSLSATTFDGIASPPLNVTVMIMNFTSFNVTWVQPKSPATVNVPFQYTLDLQKGTEDTTINDVESGSIFSHNSPCTNVRARVRLVNRAGDGNWSEWSSFVETDPSSAPSIVAPITVNASLTTSRSLFLTWPAVSVSNNCPIAYELKLNSSNDINSIDFNYYNYTNLEPYHRYWYKVRVRLGLNKTNTGNWSWSDSTGFQTLEEGALKPVEDLTCNQDTTLKSKLLCSWREPSNQVGDVIMYLTYLNDTPQLNVSTTSVTFTDLMVPMNATVVVKGFSTQTKAGRSARWTGELKAGMPSMNPSCVSNPNCLNVTDGCSYDASSQKALQPFHKVFSSSNGTITGYQVLVFKYNEPELKSKTITNNDVSKAYYIDVDSSFLTTCTVASTSTRMRREAIQVFILGTSSDCDPMKTSSCNPPLTPDTEYYVAYRAFSGGDFTTVGPFYIKTAPGPGKNVGAIVGGVIGALLVLLLIAIILVAFWRIRKTDKDRSPSNHSIISEMSLVSNDSKDRPEPQVPRPTLVMQLRTSFRTASFRRWFGSISKPSTRRPIQVHRLREAYQLGCSDGDRGFQQQYSDLSRYSAGIRKYVKHEFDRFTDIGTVPRCEEIAGVRLRPIVVRCEQEGCVDGLTLGGDGMAYPSTQYINATYIPSAQEPQWIATQGPLATTVGHFWWMVWQERPWMILMLTGIKEKGVTKCDPYFPGSERNKENESLEFPLHNQQQQPLGDLRMCVELVSSEVVIPGEPEPACVKRTFRLTVGEESHIVLHLHFTQWPDHASLDLTLLERLFTSFNQLRSADSMNNRKPVVIHCSAGVGRTGTFIAISKLVDELKAGATEVDVFGTVYELRSLRTFMVQTEEQLKLIYEYLLRYLENSGTNGNSFERIYENVPVVRNGNSSVSMTHYNPAFHKEQVL